MSITPTKMIALKNSMPSLIDSLSVATARATQLNTRQQIMAAEKEIHASALAADRGVYTLLSLLPVLDHGKQVTVLNLLRSPYSGTDNLLTAEQEFIALSIIIKYLPIQRKLKLFGELAANKVNNTRTRKLIYQAIINDPSLPYIATKYREKLKIALTHVFGLRRASILKSILAKSPMPNNIGTLKERSIVASLLGPVDNTQSECVSFILGNEISITDPMLRKYIDCKTDFSMGAGLDITTLLGLRQKYAPNVPLEEVYKMGTATMTDKVKASSQSAQAKAGVETPTEFNPMALSLLDLILYKYEKGTNEKIEKAILAKAKAAWEKFPFKYQHIGIILDASYSMKGHDTQHLRPIAQAVAAYNTLRNADKIVVQFVGDPEIKDSMIFPAGATNLAGALIAILATAIPEAIFVLSDGYENMISGRFDEVVSLLRKIHINIPIIQISTVLAAEASGIRPLSTCEGFSVLPMANINSFGVSSLKTLFETSPDMAVSMMMTNLSPMLEGGVS